MLRSKYVLMSFIIFGLFYCQNPNNVGNNSIAELQKTDFIVRTTDSPFNFCKNIYDSTTIAYRNSDTLRLAVRRNIYGCPPYSLNYKIKNDTLLLTYNELSFICTDTLRFFYLEFGFKIQSEGKIRIIAQDSTGTNKCLDTLIDTKEVKKYYTCE